MEKEIQVAVEKDSQAPTSHRVQANEGFFDWIQDPEAKRISIRQAREWPWIGLVALLGSIIITMLSFILLYFVDNRVVWSKNGWHKATQPASWLSIMLSINSICLHIALTEGVTVAWWFKATRPTTTIRHLHTIWKVGTSAKSAVTDLRALNYVSLAAMFVAIIPLNGFLLQGALSVDTVDHVFRNKTLVPMVQQLPLGYAGVPDKSGMLSGIGTPWPIVFQQATNLAGSRYSKYAFFGNDYWDGHENRKLDADLYGNRTEAVWNATVPGAGFNMTCSHDTKVFEFSDTNVSSEQPLFRSSFDFDPHWPNRIKFDLQWKHDYNCTGTYKIRDCVLEAAVVDYPVQIKLDVSNAATGPYYSLQPHTSWREDRVVRAATVYEDEMKRNSTYEGMAQSFHQWFGGNITLNYRAGDPLGGTLERSAGGFLNGLMVDYGLDGYMHSEEDFGDLCNIGLNWGIQNIVYYSLFNSEYLEDEASGGWLYSHAKEDLEDIILEQVRQASFLAAVYAGSNWYSDNYVPAGWQNADASEWWLPGENSTTGASMESYVQSVDADRTISAPTYVVRYYMWYASIALTYSIVLIILPTFWGFWVLARKPTMSPVDVARAFNAPVVIADETHQRMSVDVLLREVGSTPIHALPRLPSVSDSRSQAGGTSA